MHYLYTESQRDEREVSCAFDLELFELKSNENFQAVHLHAHMQSWFYFSNTFNDKSEHYLYCERVLEIRFDYIFCKNPHST
jgi:hypothetical protein